MYWQWSLLSHALSSLSTCAWARLHGCTVLCSQLSVVLAWLSFIPTHQVTVQPFKYPLINISNYIITPLIRPIWDQVMLRSLKRSVNQRSPKIAGCRLLLRTVLHEQYIVNRCIISCWRIYIFTWYREHKKVIAT